MKKGNKQNNLMKSTATVVDGKLMLSLPDAYTPVVWQMDLQEAASSALEVKKDEGSDRFILGLKKEDNSISEIASYEEREKAVEALMAISNAMQNAHGKIRATQNVAAPVQTMPMGQMPVMNGANQNDSSGKAGAVLAVLMVVILVVAVVTLAPRGENGMTTSTPDNTTSRSASNTGVPVSADDFLSSR